MMIRYIAIVLISTIIYSKDYDMDGVPDNIDMCSHTPFFDKVNRDGCSTKRLILPEERDNYSLDIILNYGLSHNDDSIKRETLHKSDIEIDYYRNSWIYSIKAGYLVGKDWRDIDDTTFSIKRHIQLNEKVKLTTGVGIKIPTHEFEGNRVDYSISENINYYPNDNISLFLGGEYRVVNDDINTSSIGNQYSYYFGIGYFISKNLYSNISYSNTKSKFIKQHLINTLSATIFYQINKRWFSILTYSNEILDEDFHNSLDCKIGYSFRR